ncbi:monovalent cation/H(+) antiporter subunit G [Actinocatenispora sera]|uniref:Multisubunit sodium/proton antiporter MrpG subunit n=1 Tax=Actinocatenispora sera TaxID=390989 RepID=A0A810LCP0_9ACTN|nr:monovalent cation/H(+) antiporter subunit G [Actinocatenispora sera]BCJ31748.1 hypothetical protein Asera_58560 [Actinocatenispora sera]
MTGWIGGVLVGIGVLFVVGAGWAALLFRDTLNRLHLLSPASVVGIPLVGIGLAVATGTHLSSALILLTVAVQAVTGPALTTAIARSRLRRDELLAEERR